MCGATLIDDAPEALFDEDRHSELGGALPANRFADAAEEWRKTEAPRGAKDSGNLRRSLTVDTGRITIDGDLVPDGASKVGATRAHFNRFNRESEQHKGRKPFKDKGRLDYAFTREEYDDRHPARWWDRSSNSQVDEVSSEKSGNPLRTYEEKISQPIDLAALPQTTRVYRCTQTEPVAPIELADEDDFDDLAEIEDDGNTIREEFERGWRLFLEDQWKRQGTVMMSPTDRRAFHKRLIAIRRELEPSAFPFFGPTDDEEEAADEQLYGWAPGTIAKEREAEARKRARQEATAKRSLTKAEAERFAKWLRKRKWCEHCGVGIEAGESRHGLCDACRKYKDKHDELPSEEDLRLRRWTRDFPVAT